MNATKKENNSVKTSNKIGILSGNFIETDRG